jgi:hypothetical protein
LIKRTSENEWLAEVAQVDPDLLADMKDEVCAWGRWTARTGRLLRTVDVSSALVSRSTAPALVRALQTAEDPNDYRLPNADDSFEIGTINYVLRGWIEYQDAAADFDAQDYWAADLSLGALRPGAWAIERLGLQADRLGRVWSVDDQALWIRRQSWSTGERYGDEEQDRGDRLLASPTLLNELCTRTGMTLLREVVVQHDLTGSDAWDGSKRRRQASLRLIA